LKPGEALVFNAQLRSARTPQPISAAFVPFAEAGADGGVYRVWLRAPGTAWPKNDSLLADGEESRSRPGNQQGSIMDGDPATIAVTFDARLAAEDWFAVTLPSAVDIGRVVFAHGKDFHDGGWFDASANKPRVQIQRAPGVPWETVGELADYPATTATGNTGLKPGQKFTLRLTAPIPAIAVRVIGKPACGDNVNQAFSSCGEVEAFSE
jgi:hypothetical protein